jgi:N-acetylglutamate synthase-like GNAT family acetyltransferase
MNENIKYKYEKTTIKKIIDNYENQEILVPRIQRNLI